jgi:diguanylate cyclase (GGDEF)-like protein/PAS domain S-box-containing protein
MWTESKIVRGVFDRLTDGVFFVDLEGTITFWNRAAERITGFSAEDAVGRPCRTLLIHLDEEGRDLCRIGCSFDCASSPRTEWRKEAFLLHADGRRIPVTLDISPLRDDEGKLIGGMESFADRSHQTATVEKLKELEEIVHTDTLTGTGNRRATMRLLGRKLDEFARYDWPFGVLFLDLDNFKAVNDEHGHEGGDVLLRSIARSLKHGLRASDFLGRWGGEEFVIVVSDVDSAALRSTAERFRALIEETTVQRKGQDLRVTASIGATIARNADTVEALVDRADRLMYESKFGGKNRVSADDWSPVRGTDKRAV